MASIRSYGMLIAKKSGMRWNHASDTVVHIVVNAVLGLFPD